MNKWKAMAQPPKWALKEIGAGRLKGKTDINPQWRLQAMTECYGEVGTGWKYTIDKLWTENGADGEVMAFALVSVFVHNGEWSQPVPGIGGSTLIAKEKNGMYNNDEAFKMAVTDALSVALKAFGVAADIYSGLWDGSKYREHGMASKPDADDDVITAKAWETWQELVKRATAAGINVDGVDRATTTKTHLRQVYKETLEIVNNAEAQAKAGE